MPSARSSSSAAKASPSPSRTRRPAPAPRRVPLRDSVVRVRWERVGRIALLVVLAAVIALYAEHALSYLSTHRENARQQAIVERLTRQNHALEAQKRSLTDPAAIVRRARTLGMIRPGEQPYDITTRPGSRASGR
jgi:cell division protein FtsB